MDDLLAAIALVLVFEGILPFLNPGRWKALVQMAAEQPDKNLRTMGFASMILGLMLLLVVRSFS